MRRTALVFAILAAVGSPAWGADPVTTVVIADFEAGADGFSGALAREPNGARAGKGCGRIEASLSGNTHWVTATKALDLKNELKAVRFWVRSNEAGGVTFRLVDSTGQVHKQRPTFQANGQWQQVVLHTFESGPGYEKWGGADDGKFHWPAVELAFIVEDGNLRDKRHGTVRIDQVEADLDPHPFLPPLELHQARLGNIFLTTEPVRIPLVSSAERVAWSVTDFWHAKRAEGTTQVREGHALIEPGLKSTGYFEIHLAAEKAGARIAETDTTFAIVTPLDLAQVKDSPFGVMTHFAQGWDTDILRLIARAGIKSIRDELYWAQVEKQPGQYLFDKRYDAYLAEAAKQHIDPLIAMTFENKLYDGGKTPYTPEGCAAYGRYGRAILEKYGPQIRWLEIWNEYNGTWCTGPAAEDRPRFYAQMLRYANEQVKGARPDVKVLGGGAVLIPLPYFEGIFKNGGLADMDAVVIHPYRGVPEGVDEEIAALKALMKRYNHGVAKPIWVTETGSYDHGPDGRHNVARYLVRMYTLLLSEGVERAFWYLTRDYQNFATMGLVRGDKDPMGRYVPAPGYAAYANLIRQLSGAHCLRREPTDKRTRIYVFDRGGQPIRVCWATVPAHVMLRAGGPLTVVDMMGEEQRIEPVDGRAYLTLTDNPVYVKGPVSEVRETAAFAVAPEQVADVLSPVRLRFTLDNRGANRPLAAVFEADGRKTALTCAAGARREGSLLLPDQDTSREGTRTCWYRLTLNGKLAGLGGIRVRVADPLRFAETVRVGVDRAAEVRLANTSAATAYAVESAAWQIGDAQGSWTAPVALGPGKELLLRLPAASLIPYHATPLRVTLRLKGRAPVELRAEVSDNPCPKRTARVDGDLADWQGAPAIDLAKDGQSRAGALASADDLSGAVMPAWDERYLYLAARVRDDVYTPAAGEEPYSGDAILVAVAPAGEAGAGGRIPWYEFRVTLSAPPGAPLRCTLAPTPGDLGPVEGVPASIRRVGNETFYEVAIPWERLAPLRPGDGALRLSVLACDVDGAGKRSLIEWGRGIAFGKSPARFRVCRLEGAGPTGAPLAAASLSVSPLPQAPPLARAGRVIADSTDDYSNVQGKAGWWYGYYPGTGKGKGDGLAPGGPHTDDDFEEMHYVETVWGYEWAGPFQYMMLGRDTAHPQAASGQPVWAVRRWQSPLEGTVRVTGHLARGNKEGDGVEACILVDGEVRFSRQVGGPNAPGAFDYETSFRVKKGSRVDFAITPGPGLSVEYDASSFTARIETVE